MLSGLPSVACASSGRRMPRHGAVARQRLLKHSAAVALRRCWSRFLRSRTVEISRTPRCRKPGAESVSRPATIMKSALHQKRALTTPHLGTMVRPSTIERIGSSKISQSEVDWVIQLGRATCWATRPEKSDCSREDQLGFGTAKAVIASGAVTVHAPRC